MLRAVTVSSDGQHIAAGSRDGVLEVWRGGDQRYWRVPHAHKGAYFRKFLQRSTCD